MIGPSAPPFAGGQVATASSLGFLGNRGIFDAPFNVTSYTSKTIEDQQARSLADVLSNSPSVRAPSASDGVFDNFMIRGFPVTAAAFTMEGLYGVLPAQMVAVEFISRLELLTGPSAFLNSATPFGPVGGTINIVPKRAEDVPLTAITGTFGSDGQFGTHVDVGRRYGAKNEFGIRFNGVYRDGATAVDNQFERLGLAVLALDYRGENVRATLDAGYQDQRFDAPLLSMVYNGPAGRVLEPPRAGSNPFQPWSYNHARDHWVVGRAEVDVTDTTTAYAALGYKNDLSILLSPYQEIEDRAGNTTVYPYFEPYSAKVISADTGIRSKFQTGPVGHQLTLGFSGSRTDIGFSDTFFDSFASNIYQPVVGPEPNVSGLSTDPPLGARYTLSSVAIGDTLSFFQDSLLLTVGARHQVVRLQNFDGATGVETSDSTTSRTSPGIGIVFKPAANVSLYGNYIEGLTTLIAPSSAINRGEIFPPAVSKQLEGGIKLNLGRLGTTLSVFDITKPFGFVQDNGFFAINGQQRNRGVEWNVFGEINPGTRILGGVAFIQGELTETLNGANNGNTAPGVPLVQVNLGGEYDLPFLPGVTLLARGIYTSTQYLDTDNLQYLPDWARLDLGARYATVINGVPTTFRVNVENVTNNSYWASGANGILTIGAPRRVLVSGTVKF